MCRTHFTNEENNKHISKALESLGGLDEPSSLALCAVFPLSDLVSELSGQRHLLAECFKSSL